MGSNAGSGYPITFRCFAERREFGEWRRRYRHEATRTGRTKAAPSRGKGNPRKLPLSHEYICSCGHVGWSCISGIQNLPLRTEEKK